MRLLLLLVFLILSIRIQASPRFIQNDSLELILQSSAQDTNRVLILTSLALKYVTSQPAKASTWAEEALVLARQLKFPKGEIAALNCLSDFYFRQSNYPLSIDYATETRKIASQYGDSLAMADAYRLLGNTYNYGLKQFDKALDYHLKAIAIYERQNEKVKVAAEYGSITWIYAMMNKDLDEAFRMARKGVAIAKQLGNHQIESYNYNSIGLLFEKEKKYDSALINFDLSNHHARLVDDRGVIVYNKSIIGDIYLQQGNYDVALDYFTQSLNESKQINFREIVKNSYLGLAQCYYNLKQPDKAYQYHVQYAQLKDSLLNWETNQQTLLIQHEFEKEREEALIKQLKKEKQLYTFLFASGIFIMLIILLLIINNNRNRRKANRLLQEKNEEISTQNEELLQSREEISAQRDTVAEQNTKLQQANDVKDKLFSIIGHDLRSPIASLRGLLALVQKEVVTTDELKTLTPKIHQNVGALHEMLENLLHWSYTQMKGFKSDPTRLSAQVIIEDSLMLLDEILKAKKISIENKLADELIAYADENHVKLIFRNLLHNAIKFTPENGTVRIAGNRSDEFVVIEITDTGIGISAERINTLFATQSHFTSRGTQGEKGTGLGLVLCREMAEMNGGKINVQSTEGKGSTFSVYLKAHE